MSWHVFYHFTADISTRSHPVLGQRSFAYICQGTKDAVSHTFMSHKWIRMSTDWETLVQGLVCKPGSPCSEPSTQPWLQKLCPNHSGKFGVTLALPMACLMSPGNDASVLPCTTSWQHWMLPTMHLHYQEVMWACQGPSWLNLSCISHARGTVKATQKGWNRW